MSQSANGQVRTWTDKTGTFQIEAELVKVSDGKVTLRKSDNKLKTVTVDLLSAADQAFVRDHANGSGEAAAESAPSDPLAVPATDDVKELLAFLKRLKNYKPPATITRAELPQVQAKVVRSIFEASNLVLANSKATKSQLESAATSKLASLDFMGRSDPSDEVTKLVDQFPAELTELGMDKLTKNANTIVVTRKLLVAETPEGAKQAIGSILDHLTNFGPLGNSELKLIQNVGDLSERLGTETAVSTYESIGKILQNDPRAKRFAPAMFGSARRLGLVGNEMKVQGITPDDKKFNLTEYKGKVVLVDFWATWCGPCRQEMPNVLQNYKKYHERGFEVVAISTDRELGALDSYLAQEKPPWTVLVDNHPDNPQSMGDYYGITAIPTTILIGPDGKVITMRCRGPQLGMYLEKLLGDVPAAPSADDDPLGIEETVDAINE